MIFCGFIPSSRNFNVKHSCIHHFINEVPLKLAKRLSFNRYSMVAGIRIVFFCNFLEIMASQILIFFCVQDFSHILWLRILAPVRKSVGQQTTKPSSHKQTDRFCVKFMRTATVYLYLHCANDLVT